MRGKKLKLTATGNTGATGRNYYISRGAVAQCNNPSCNNPSKSPFAKGRLKGIGLFHKTFANFYKTLSISISLCQFYKALPIL